MSADMDDKPFDFPSLLILIDHELGAMPPALMSRAEKLLHACRINIRRALPLSGGDLVEISVAPSDLRAASIADALKADQRVSIDEAVKHEFNHPPGGMPPSPETRIILAAIEELKQTMTVQSVALQQAIAGLLAEQTDLATEVAVLIADDEAKTQSTAQAVATALAAEGVSEDAIAATVKTVTDAMSAQSASIKALFPTATPPPPAVVISPASIEGVAGVALTGQFAASGATGNLSWSTTDLPPDISVSGTGTISGTPTAAEAGDAKVTYVSDDGTTGEADLPYTITAPAGS